MTIQELETLIVSVQAQLDLENTTLSEIYGLLSVQQATVDALNSKMKRLQHAKAILSGIEVEEEVTP